MYSLFEVIIQHDQRLSVAAGWAELHIGFAGPFSFNICRVLSSPCRTFPGITSGVTRHTLAAASLPRLSTASWTWSAVTISPPGGQTPAPDSMEENTSNILYNKMAMAEGDAKLSGMTEGLMGVGTKLVFPVSSWQCLRA